MLCKKLHHAAYRCKDAADTVKFYTEVLGLRFTHAMGEDHVPSTGQYSPHIHIFFECPRDPGQMKDMESPGWIQHFAFEVADVDTVLRAKQELLERGIAVVGPTNHDDFITSIYFFDPSGHRLELTARTADAARHQVFEQEAMQVLALWNQTHDWSQREKLYGAQTGYARADR
jgi:catechol 2,3-dioxygenase-like lactoylglutathione lyase family enzyme